MESEFSQRRKDLQDFAAKIKGMAEKLDKDTPVLAETDRVKRQRELADMDQDFQRKQRAYREDVSQRMNEETAKFWKIILKAGNGKPGEQEEKLIKSLNILFESIKKYSGQNK